MSTRSVVIAAMIILASVTVVAQEGLSLGPQLGFYKARDADDATVMGGLSLRVRLSDAFGIEGSINARKERYANGTVTVKTWPVMVTGLIYPVPVAYGAIGAGWYNSNLSYTFPVGSGGSATYTSETQQAFGWHFGGGVELPVGSVARFIGDIRYVFLDYEFQSFPGSNDVSSNFYVMTVGLLFNL